MTTLEATPVLDGRYRDLKLVNVDPGTGVARGVFSLVFRAYDMLDMRYVALKFYDIDPAKITDVYRLDSFKREHALLQSLVSAPRCLQLLSPFAEYKLAVSLPGGHSFEIPCN